MIKCQVEHCKNNKDGKCTIENVSISFNWDIYSASCDNFCESKNYIRSHYTIKELSNGDILLIQLRADTNIAEYLEQAMNDIVENSNKDKYTVYVDTLISCYNAHTSNRFFKFEFEKEQDINEIYKGIKVVSPKRETDFGYEVRSLTCNILKENYGEHLNLLSSALTKMIKKGIVV